MSSPPPPNLPDVRPGEDGGDYASRKAVERAALCAAIRRFTVEAPEDKPNGKVEAAIDRIQDLLDPAAWAQESDPSQRVRDLNGAMADLTEGLVEDTEALKAAAEAFLGGDFAKPLDEDSAQILALAEVETKPAIRGHRYRCPCGEVFGEKKMAEHEPHQFLVGQRIAKLCPCPFPIEGHDDVRCELDADHPERTHSHTLPNGAVIHWDYINPARVEAGFIQAHDVFEAVLSMVSVREPVEQPTAVSPLNAAISAAHDADAKVSEARSARLTAVTAMGKIKAAEALSNARAAANKAWSKVERLAGGVA